MGEVRENLPVASWKVGGAEVVQFPITDFAQAGGNRIVQHERAYRDGARLDDTGSKARQWTFTAHFGNRLEEPGIPATVNLYPTVLRQLIRSFDEHETGDLILPPIGKVRARAETYNWRETPDEDDAATIELVYTEDNEDALDRAVLDLPGVTATIFKLAEQTTFTAQKNGAWNDDLASLTEVCSEIEGLMLAPGRGVSDLGAVIRAHRRALQGLLQTTATVLGQGDALSEPRASDTHRQVRTMMDREAQAEEERTQSRPRTKAFVIDVERTSIFEVAARFDQDAEELLDLNGARIEDPFLLVRGDVIRLFESAAR
jgi:prophage DNA circulation protein